MDVSTAAEIAAIPALELPALYRRRQLSPVDVTQAVLDRAEEVQQDLNCFYEIDHKGASRSAKDSETRWLANEEIGLLDGVPATVKENIAVAGFRRPSGSAAYADAPRESSDGPATARLREAGAPIIGLSVMPDLGMLSSGVSSLHGVTRSPWNPEWTVGGSSGGAGAAAAAGVGPLHLGSDIAGSVRLPATWLGLFSLKPTFGRVPVDPPYMGRVVGPLTRTVADAILVLSEISRPDVRDCSSLTIDPVDWHSLLRPLPESMIRGMKVAFHLDAGAGIPTDPEVEALVGDAVAHFEAAGAAVTEITPPMTPDYLDGLDMFLRARSLASIVALDDDHQAKLLPFVREWARGAEHTSAVEAVRNLQTIWSLRHDTIMRTSPYDLVLSPVSAVAAFPAEWPMPTNTPETALHHVAYAVPYNISEQPAASINCGFTTDGRPVGLQIAGRRFADAQVLKAARWYELTRPESAIPVWPR
ncbi:amidase [Rhodococcus marinonascens]|uniref:amidase n=1 Tax=Rhodococcus marinonascens TaxID=38311 RepID=UPI0009335BC1|nr:amidase [Rhodococcus marinonascens]